MEIAQGFFYVSVGLGVWIVVVAFTVLAIESIKTVRLLKSTIADVKHGIADLEAIKSGIKLGVLTLVGNLIGSKLGKGGEENDK